METKGNVVTERNHVELLDPKNTRVLDRTLSSIGSGYTKEISMINTIKNVPNLITKKGKVAPVTI